MIRLVVGLLLTGSSDWTDAPDSRGAGRNKLALHERYTHSSKNIVY